MNNLSVLKRIAPEYPSILHLPHNPNFSSEDRVASEKEAEIIFSGRDVSVYEKLDGANVGIGWHDGEPIVRNRKHILNKGYLKCTPAKMQFRPLWNWVYDNKDKFKHLQELLSGDEEPVDFCVYGEWMMAQHGLYYDNLPSYFLAYDIYVDGRFLSPVQTDLSLAFTEFNVAPKIGSNPKSYEELASYCQEKSLYSRSKREGVVVKLADQRFKMVRPDFVRGALWDEKELHKNQLAHTAG